MYILFVFVTVVKELEYVFIHSLFAAIVLQAFAEQLQGALQACGRGEGYDIILDALGGMYFKVFKKWEDWGMVRRW